MAESDWNDVTVLRKQRPKASDLRSAQAVNAAQRRGIEIDRAKKWSAGQNKQHTIDKNTSKLDRETEELHHSTVTRNLSMLIQQGRQAKKFTQKELAVKINEKPQVVNDYESGRAIPNQLVLSKLERCLGIKLRGKDRDLGKPLEPTKKK